VICDPAHPDFPEETEITRLEEGDIIFRMNRVLKTLLIWILIAVLPLSSAAAAVGMSCAPGHQQAMNGSMSHDVGGVMDDESGIHHAAPGHSSSASDASAPADMPSASAGHADHSSCSACSAFCMGAAAPPPVAFAIPSFSGAEDVIVPAVPRVSGFIPEGLRRPPRQHSA
jgi:hypothetical protein